MTSDQDEGVQMSWSVYHASLLAESVVDGKPVDITALLHLFEEQAKSVAMIKHSMHIVSQTTNFLNSGQTPVIACDQPLYVIAKQIQWILPDIYGENMYVVMSGALHIEIAALKTIGDWLENSGWTHALEQASIATSGTAE